MARIYPETVTVQMELANAWLVRPGDKLVLAIGHPVSQQQVDLIRERLAGALPGVETVIVDDISAMAVYQPDGPADGTQP